MPRGGDQYSGFGGGDDGLDDNEDLEAQVDDQDQEDSGDDRDRKRTVTSTSTKSQEQTNSRTAESDNEQPEIPHRVRYDSPKDGRDHAKTLVFNDDDKRRLSDLESLAEQEFDEEVYRLDVYLAGLRSGLRSTDDRFLEEMREIGYGYFD